MDHPDFAVRRQEMVRQQIASRGMREPLVLDAMLAVPREEFVPLAMREFAYEDTPLALPDAAVLQQPWVLAVGLAALALRGGERVLEIGTGCGYASTLLARIAAEVYTVEPDARLAEQAASRFALHGARNVHVRHGPAEAGWAEQAPYDAILVHVELPQAARRALCEQLAHGGRLVASAPGGSRAPELIRIRRISELQYQREDIADVHRLIPQPAPQPAGGAQAREAAEAALAVAVARHAEVFEDLDDVDLEPLLRRIGQARVVLIGDATHGTSEFYRMRQRITRALIERRGFDFVAIESDWPDAARIDQYVRQADVSPARWQAFARFPTWMWRNREVAAFVDWLHAFNSSLPATQRVAFYGLDLYSLHRSIERVLEYLDRVDPEASRIARQRYGCLSPWEADPSSYAHAALSAGYRSCEQEVVAMLRDMLHSQGDYTAGDGESFLDALQNARLVANAERYYRTMYYGSRASWNLRDGHMFETLRTLLDFRGPHSRAVVWAHNSHVGDSAATEMGARGEFNLGRLCRRHFGAAACSIGMASHAGEVAAAERWDGPLQVMALRPSLEHSWERVFHDSGAPGLLLGLRAAAPGAELGELLRPRLQRAVGVVYRPHSELASHYFESVLARQFDEFIWIDRSHAVSPLAAAQAQGLGQTYPFGV